MSNNTLLTNELILELVKTVNNSKFGKEEVEMLCYQIARNQWAVMVHLCTLLTGNKPNWKKQQQNA